MKSILKSIGVATLCAMSASAAIADQFPTKPVTMVIPFAAGGPTDVVGRVVAQAMSVALKQTVVVENTAGAGGTLAGARVARAAAADAAELQRLLAARPGSTPAEWVLEHLKA